MDISISVTLYCQSLKNTRVQIVALTNVNNNILKTL